MDKARLRENARIVRTLLGEREALVAVQIDRLKKETVERMKAAREKGEPLDRRHVDEQAKIDAAETELLLALINAFLDLTDELAGDIDQDL